jgi:hypothetical protein
MSSGCENCGSCPVGDPLPRPQHELPSYGRSLALVVSGALVVLIFISQTIIALVQHRPFSFGFWSWAAAGETAAWRLKWIALPVMFALLWIGRKIYRSILRAPERFCGIKYARRGLLASALVSLLFAVLIGITVPARLRQRQLSIDAASRAQYYTLDRAFFEYRLRFGTLPTDPSNLRDALKRIPDPDGSIAAALRGLDTNYYKPTADVASNKQKSPTLRGAVITRVSLNSATDDTLSDGLSLNNYELRLPGEDGIYGNDDDWIGHNGVIMRITDVATGGVGRNASLGALKP